MKEFYCDDFYWLVTVGGLERGLFALEADARQLFDKLDPQVEDGDVMLHRLNGGYLCTPPAAVRLYVENARAELIGEIPMTEYLSRNMQHARAVGAYYNTEALLHRLKGLRRPAAKWLVQGVEGILERVTGLHNSIAEWRDAAPDRPKYGSALAGQDHVFLLQDTRSYVGNCPMWWKETGGYTSRIDLAKRFTLLEAADQLRIRDTDLPWSMADIAQLCRPTIDHQYLPRSADQQRERFGQLAKLHRRS